jgi:hypothetical protein
MFFLGTFYSPNIDTVIARYNGLGYNEQNLAVYNCEFLQLLRH